MTASFLGIFILLSSLVLWGGVGWGGIITSCLSAFHTYLPHGCAECGLSLLLPKMCIRSWLKSWNERKTSTWKCETWNEKASSSKPDLEESKNAAIDKTTGKNQAKSTSGGWKSRRSSISCLPCSSMKFAISIYMVLEHINTHHAIIRCEIHGEFSSRNSVSWITCSRLHIWRGWKHFVSIDELCVQAMWPILSAECRCLMVGHKRLTNSVSDGWICNIRFATTTWFTFR